MNSRLTYVPMPQQDYSIVNSGNNPPADVPGGETINRANYTSPDRYPVTGKKLTQKLKMRADVGPALENKEISGHKNSNGRKQSQSKSKHVST